VATVDSLYTWQGLPSSNDRQLLNRPTNNNSAHKHAQAVVSSIRIHNNMVPSMLFLAVAVFAAAASGAAAAAPAADSMNSALKELPKPLMADVEKLMKKLAGLTPVHFSPQPELFLTLETYPKRLRTPSTPATITH